MALFKKKRLKSWNWLVLDRQTKEVIRVFVGDKRRESAKKLWSTLPVMYKQCAVIYTDKWKAYFKMRWGRFQLVFCFLKILIFFNNLLILILLEFFQ